MIWLLVAAIWLLAIWTIVYQPVYRIGEWWWDRRASRRSAATYTAAIHDTTTHTHGAWCHPSADGCPDRPGA